MRYLAGAVQVLGAMAGLIGTAVEPSGLAALGSSGGAPAASMAAASQIPAAMLTLYREAAAACHDLPWAILRFDR